MSGKWYSFSVVINHKTTKFESNSQHDSYNPDDVRSCYQSQNYKIWKQFTTYSSYTLMYQLLLSIAKLQNLKAIHNCEHRGFVTPRVVINCKTTKFESNSQPNGQNNDYPTSCYQSQNYKIWKQFTTDSVMLLFVQVLLSIAKLQNLKAIHN